MERGTALVRTSTRLLSAAVIGAVCLSTLVAGPGMAAEPTAGTPATSEDAAAPDAYAPGVAPAPDASTPLTREASAPVAVDPSALTEQVDPDPYLLEEAEAARASLDPLLAAAAVAPPMPPQLYNGEVRAAIGSWAGFSNGQIPQDVMCAPFWDTVERFRCDAATALTAMNQAFRAVFGTNLAITDSYRTYDEQVQLKISKPTLAATPGTSNHGWGLAVDLSSSINVFGSPQHNWMRANANRFGWYHPAWAQFYGSLPEPWHWEYAGAAASGDPAHAKALGLELARYQSWTTPTERACLSDLWQQRSGWNYRAVGAGDLRGLPMASMTAMYGSAWAGSSGAALYLSNPQTQVERGLRAITTSYGSACVARGGGAALVDVSASPATVTYGGPVTVIGQVIGTVDWSMTVTEPRTGVVVHRSTGTASSDAVLNISWDGKNAGGQPVGISRYRIDLVGTDSATGKPVRPVSTTVDVTGSQNPPQAPLVPLAADLTFVPVPPTRLVDTRLTAQALGPVSRMDVPVVGLGGVPAGAKAVAVNVTAVSPTENTYIAAWPAGRSRPTTSVLNTDPRRNASAAGVILGIGGEGKVSLFNNAGSTHLVVDVTGYYTSAAGVGYAPLTTAARVLDTRTSGPVPTPGAPRTVQLAGFGGVPANATAVVLNVTSAVANGDGYVAVVPRGGAVTTSSVNHLPGADVANRATVALVDGKVDVHAAGATGDVVVDVVGWYGPTGTARFTPVQPQRVMDTRLTGDPVDAGETVTAPVAAAAALPAGSVAAALTLTTTQQTAGSTYLTAWATGTARPETSDLNTGAGRDQANMAIVGLGSAGGVDFYNLAGATHLVVDLTGYFRTP